MSLEWYDAPEAIKYVRFEEDNPAYQADGYSSLDRVSLNSTHQDVVSQISCPLSDSGITSESLFPSINATSLSITI